MWCFVLLHITSDLQNQLLIPSDETLRMLLDAEDVPFAGGTRRRPSF
jgi:hypothetical protein